MSQAFGIIWLMAGNIFHVDLKSTQHKNAAFRNAEGGVPYFNQPGYFSEYSTCTTVWPTAPSVALSIFSIVSFTVCHVGPKLLVWQSG